MPQHALLTPEELVRAWEGRIFNLAWRMLRDPARAEDLTQDILARAIERQGDVDPARGIGPWIYRLATNHVLNHIRNEATRRSREAEAAQRRHETEADMRRMDMEEQVQTHVRALPAQARVLLVLHYYSGLSKSEIASVLDVPRTTVQSRMAAALGSLKSRLAGAGLAGLAPTCEVVMRGTPAATHLPSPGGPLEQTIAAATNAGVTVGGILVTKKLIAAGVVLALLSGSAGFWIAEARRIDDDASAASGANLRTAEAPADPGASRSAELAGGAAAHTARQVGDRTEGVTSTDEVSSPNEGATPAGESPQEAAAGEGDGTSEVDWSRFESMLAEHRSLFVKATHEGADSLPAEQVLIGQEFVIEFMRLMVRLQARSSAPSTDPGMFGDFAVAFYASALPEDDDSRARLRSEAKAALEEAFRDVDRARTLPLKQRDLRRKAARHVLTWVRKEAGESHSQIVDELEVLRHALMGGGPFMHVKIGVGEQPYSKEKHPVQAVLEAWDSEFEFTEDQQGVAREAAEALVKAAEDALKRRNLDPAEGEVPFDVRGELDLEFQRLQRDAEARFAPLLSKEQFATALHEGPLLLDFFWGHGWSVEEGFGGF